MDALRVRLFSSSLSGSAFAWFMTLPANSIVYWSDLKKQFHQYFFSGIHEKTITDLTSLRQRNDESVASFIQKVRETRNKCYSVVLTDVQLAQIAFEGLLPYLREKYDSQEFESLSHIVRRVSKHENRIYDQKRSYQKKINFVEY